MEHGTLGCVPHGRKSTADSPHTYLEVRGYLPLRLARVSVCVRVDPGVAVKCRSLPLARL